MQQPVHAAKVDEGAVVGNVLYHAIQDHALLQALDQFAALLGARFFQHGPAGNNDVAAGAVHLQDLERLRLADQRLHVAHGADIDLAARQEGDGAAEIDGKAALDAAVDDAGDALALLKGLFQVGPRLFAPRLFAREHDRAVAVLIALDVEFDGVAGLDLGLAAGRAELLQRDAAFALQANIDDGVIVGQAQHAAGDDGAVET